MIILTFWKICIIKLTFCSFQGNNTLVEDHCLRQKLMARYVLELSLFIFSYPLIFVHMYIFYVFCIPLLRLELIVRR